MMDENGIRAEFMFLLSDRREGRRKEAAEKIAGSGIARAGDLAEAGMKIAAVLHQGAGPETLGEAVGAFRRLPMTDFWQKFIEQAGQAVLASGLSAKEESRKELLRHGLDMAALAIGGGFPVSDGTIGLIEKAKAAESGLADIADVMLKNRALAPHDEALRAFRKRSPAAPREKGRQVR